MIRSPYFAGGFYPAEKKELNNLLNDLFKKSVDFQLAKKKIKALISPHAGYIYSGIVAAAGYKLLKYFSENFKKVLLLGPSHQIAITRPYADGNEKWTTPLGEAMVSRDFLEGILNLPVSLRAHQFEHSLETQLPFLQKVLGNFSIAPVVLNEFDEKLAENLKKNISDDLLIIASSDLSHYLPYDEAIQRDKKTIETILNLEINKFTDDSACGNAAILTLMKLAKKLGWQAKLIDYRNSGDTAGDKERVVGYTSIIFLS